jgi:hypothetical protein
MPAMSAAALLLAAGVSANTTLTAVSPSEASILGGTTLRVTGTGFVVAATAQGGGALCRVGWNWGGWAFNSTTPPFPGAAPTTPATLINSTLLTCAAPALPNAGYVSMQVSLDGGTTWAGQGVHDQPMLRYFAPFSAAVHRRPYVSEPTAKLLLNIHPSLHVASTLQVSAVHAGKQVLPLTATTVGRSANASFPTSLLPDRVDGYLEVTLHVDGKPLVTENVRLVRAVLPTASGQQHTHQPVVSVDYETRGVLVEGMPLLAFGYD